MTKCSANPVRSRAIRGRENPPCDRVLNDPLFRLVCAGRNAAPRAINRERISRATTCPILSLIERLCVLATEPDLDLCFVAASRQDCSIVAIFSETVRLYREF